MILDPVKAFDGPIPGENLTSDTKNYPWHRPPDLIDYDEIVEYMIGQIMEPRTMNGIMSFIGAGATISSLTSYMMLTNIGKGKFQIDMALLAAGPIARLLQILAEDAGFDYDLGVDDDFERISPNMVRMALNDPDIIPDDDFIEPTEEETPEPTGLMDPSIPETVASEEEQAAMLGLNEVEDE